jgi:hypothetical protein
MGTTERQVLATTTKVFVLFWIYMYISVVTRPKIVTAKNAPTSTPLTKRDVKITMAVLLPEWPLPFSDKQYPYFKQMLFPGLDIALEKFDRIVPGVSNVSIFYTDTACSSRVTQIATVDLRYQHHSDVYLGPVCLYATSPTALLSAHWGVPILTVGAQAYGFDNKLEYTTLTRVQGPFTKMGMCIRDYLIRQNWNNTAILHVSVEGENNDCEFGAGAVYFTLITSGFKLPEGVGLKSEEIDDKPSLLRVLNDYVKPNARSKSFHLATFDFVKQ